MDKKELKWYEAPACEVVELNVMSTLLAGSGGDGGAGGGTDFSEEDEL
jgi:hypothetical protein